MAFVIHRSPVVCAVPGAPEVPGLALRHQRPHPRGRAGAPHQLMSFRRLGLTVQLGFTPHDLVQNCYWF